MTEKPNSRDPEIDLRTQAVVSKLLGGSGVRLRPVAGEDALAVPAESDAAAELLTFAGGAGKYQIHKEIARGGIGVIMGGRDDELGRRVAVKVLQDRHLQSPNVVRRFIEEAQIGGQLQHPGIVPVYELGLHDGLPFFAMKLIKGRTLANLLEERPPGDLQLPRFLGIFESVCHTVAYAHARGVIHRDLKPANIMVGQFGEVQVVDWGMAKVLNAEEAAAKSDEGVSTVRSAAANGDSESLDGSVIGTPAYMPPEQARGETEFLDERSDVFGIGAILCQILTGQPPFVGPTDQALLDAAMGEIEDALRRLRSCGADEEVVTLALQCLAEQPEDRPATARVVVDRISAYRGGVERRAEEAKVLAAEARGRARSTITLAGAAVVLVLVVAGAWTYIRTEAAHREVVANGRVDKLLADVDAAAAEARAAGWQELDKWTHAEELAVRAVADAGLDDVEGSRLARAESQMASIRSGKAEAGAEAERRAVDRELLRRLELVRIPQDEGFTLSGWEAGDVRRQAVAYRLLFKAYCGDRELQLMTVDGAVALLRGNIAHQLAGAIDLWRVSMLRCNQTGAGIEAEDIGFLRRLADRLDEDEGDAWRRELRALLGGLPDSRGDLLALADKTLIDGLTVPSVTLLAEGLILAGEEARARSVYAEGQHRYPEDFGISFRLGVLAARQNDWADAATRFRVSRALRPDLVPPRHMLGFMLSLTGQEKEAAGVFLDLLRDDPRNAHFAYHLGAILFELDRLDESVRWLELARDEDSDSALIKVVLERSHAKREGRPMSLDLLRAAVRSDPRNAITRASLASPLMLKERYEEALPHLRFLVANGENMKRWSALLGSALRNLGKPREAVEELTPIAATGGLSSAGLCALGSAHADLGQIREGRAAFARAMALDPNDAFPHYGLARIASLEGDVAAEARELRRTLALAPDHAAAAFNLFKLLRDSGQKEEALGLAREVIASPGATREAYARFSVPLMRVGAYREAELAFRGIIEDGSDVDHEDWFNLGNSLSAQMRFAESAAAMRRSIEIKPDFASALINHAYVLARSDQLAAGLAVSESSLQEHPDRIRLAFFVAQFRLDLGLVEGAREAAADLRVVMEKWATQNPGQRPPFSVEQLEQSIQQRGPGLASLRAFVEDDAMRTEGQSLTKAGDLARKMGRFARAVVLFERADGEGGLTKTASLAAGRAALRHAAAAETAVAERVRLRKLGLRWLQRARDAGDADLLEQLRVVSGTGDVDGVRGQALALLPESERDAWRVFWESLAKK